MSSPFRSRTSAWLVGVGAASLLAAVLLTAFGEELGGITSPFADGFSRSAIGHRGLRETLRELGVPVVASRHRSAEKAGQDGLLLLIEPGAGRADALRDMLAGVRRAVLVLPKRTGMPNRLRPGWLESCHLLPPAAAEEVLSAAGLRGRVVRPAGQVTSWRSKRPLPDPALDSPQLVVAEGLEPLLSAPEGVLAGERRTEELDLVVIADPDLLANHGLGRGENAALVVALLAPLLPAAGPVVMDETLHGFEEVPSVWRELLRPPLVLTTAQALLVGLAALWSGSARFGRPRPEPPPLAAGKRMLLDNTADLLRHGGHLSHALRAYWRHAFDSVASSLHAPPGLDPARLAWLARLSRARGAADPVDLAVAGLPQSGPAERQALDLALRIHRWREEMIDGSRSHPGPR